MNFTPRLYQAIDVATTAHREQTRKGGQIPYIIHPFGVMCVAASVTDDEDILIACLFHDIIEDVPEKYSKERMRTEFGERVVSIVEGVTHDVTIADWQTRSDAYLARLQAGSIESVIVSAADKIHNLMSTLYDYETVGDAVWNRFSVAKERQLWWYESIHEVLKSRIPDSPLTTKLGELLKQFPDQSA